MNKIKMKAVNKLVEKGFDTEKKVLKIDMDTVCESGLESELSFIVSLQKAIKEHRVFAFLMDGSDEEKKEAKSNGERDINY